MLQAAHPRVYTSVHTVVLLLCAPYLCGTKPPTEVCNRIDARFCLTQARWEEATEVAFSRHQLFQSIKVTGSKGLQECITNCFPFSCCSEVLAATCSICPSCCSCSRGHD